MVVAELEHLALDQRSRSRGRSPARRPHSQRPVELERPVQPNPQHHLGVEVPSRATPCLPDARIFLLPPLEDAVDYLQQDLASRLGQYFSRLPACIRGLHQLPIDIELHLVDRGVADPHRFRSPVAFELIEHELRQAIVTIDPVHDLEVLRVPIVGRAYPAHKAVGLVVEAHFAESVDQV